MNAAQLVKLIRARGATIEAIGPDRLRVDKRLLVADLEEQIVAHKTELIEFLDRWQDDFYALLPMAQPAAPLTPANLLLTIRGRGCPVSLTPEGKIAVGHTDRLGDLTDEIRANREALIELLEAEVIPADAKRQDKDACVRHPERWVHRYAVVNGEGIPLCEECWVFRALSIAKGEEQEAQYGQLFDEAAS